MAKPIRATPVVKGKDAKQIAQEIREGTPRTAKREATMRRAREVFESSTAKSGWVQR